MRVRRFVVVLGCVLASSVVGGVAVGAEPPKEIPVSEVEVLRIDNLSLQVRVLELQRQLLLLERERQAREVSGKAGVSWDDYDLDLAARVLRQRVKSEVSPPRSERKKE